MKSGEAQSSPTPVPHREKEGWSVRQSRPASWAYLMLARLLTVISAIATARIVYARTHRGDVPQQFVLHECWLHVRLLLLPMMLDVGFCRFLCVLGGMNMVSMRNVGVVRSFLVSAGFVVFCRFLMMPRGVLVMLGGFLMMVCCLY